MTYTELPIKDETFNDDRKLLVLTLFLLEGEGGQLDPPPCSFFFMNSKGIGRRLLKFSDFS